MRLLKMLYMFRASTQEGEEPSEEVNEESKEEPWWSQLQEEEEESETVCKVSKPFCARFPSNFINQCTSQKSKYQEFFMFHRDEQYICLK